MTSTQNREHELRESRQRECRNGIDFRKNGSRSKHGFDKVFRGVDPHAPAHDLALLLAANQTLDLNELAQSVYGIHFERVIPRIRKRLRRLSKRAAGRADKQYVGFRRRLRRTWNPGLRLLSQVCEASYSFGAELNAQYVQRAFDTEDLLFYCLMKLHARACRLFREIECLLRNGFADGAHGRWRSLHELSVVARVISRHGHDAAVRFFAHEQALTYLAMREYQDHCAKLEQPAYAQSVITAAEDDYNAVIEKYGKSFSLPYGWAHTLLGIDRCGLERLESEVGLDHLRPYYRMASLNVHTYSKSLFFELGSPQGKLPLLMAGPSNLGLADPAVQSCHSLQLVNYAVLRHWPAWHGLPPRT